MDLRKGGALKRGRCIFFYSITYKDPSHKGFITADSFAHQHKLREFKCPEGLRTIYGYVFYGCGMLKHVEFNERLDTIRASAFAHTNIDSIVLPNSVRYLGHNAFGDNTSLKYVRLNEGLTCVEHDAFSYTAIDSIVIPQSVEYLNGF